MACIEKSLENRAVPSKYIPELDGLRAIAIIGVLLFHLHVPGAELGWAGVQLFFVLSGFLITGILLNSKMREGYFSRFYIRRSLRIFPIYYLLLGVVLLYAVLRQVPYSGFPFYFFYLQNYYIGWTANHTQFPGLFAHTWTLAVEEQFYLIWPLVVWLMSPQYLIRFCGLLVAGGLCFRIAVGAWTMNSFLADSALPSCVDALALGALLATLYHTKPKLWLINGAKPLIFGFVFSAGLMLTALSVMGWGQINETNTWLSGNAAGMRMLLFAGIIFSSACMIALCLNADTIPAVVKYRQILRSQPLVHIGKISYGLYLYHGVTFYFVENGCLSLGLKVGGKWPLAYWALQLFVAWLVAFLSFLLIEKPFLQLKSRFE